MKIVGQNRCIVGQNRCIDARDEGTVVTDFITSDLSTGMMNGMKTKPYSNNLTIIFRTIGIRFNLYFVSPK